MDTKLHKLIDIANRLDETNRLLAIIADTLQRLLPRGDDLVSKHARDDNYGYDYSKNHVPATFNGY